MKLTTIGIDLAKNVFQVHGADDQGRAVLKKQLKRAEVLPMPAVPIKNAEQQAVLSLHRARQGFVKARSAQTNQIRGLLAEYGIAIAQGIRHLPKRVPEILEEGQHELPGSFRLLIQRLLEHLCGIGRMPPAGSWRDG